MNFHTNVFLILWLILFNICSNPQTIKNFPSVNFKGNAQIEVGNHFMGIELHHSSPMLQRISFYYPTANSLDLSSDYWKRDSTFIMAACLSINGNKEWIGLESWKFISNPYSIKFSKKDSKKSISISYNFCKNKPAMVITYEIINNSNETKQYELETQLETTLRTCQSYKIKDKAWTEFDKNNSTMYTHFKDSETQEAQIFVSNVGKLPDSFNSISYLNTAGYSNKWWKNIDWTKKGKIISKENLQRPAAYFLYKKKLAPNESMKIIQIVGMCKSEEERGIIKYLRSNYKNEMIDFEKYVLSEINKTKFKTNDKSLDETYSWAKAVLAVNKHFINGSIQPMPCPAEYNFYFTHDVLLTDLAAASFDPDRVKKDLNFIISHSTKDFIIPHAYYWKDTAYITEYCTPDNWNHFWFIILSGTYLRHSLDKILLNKLYPYLSKSLEQTLQNKKDDLMWAYRPDWWDIGRNYGPRSYMTIQAIKAIREYIFISTVLCKNEALLYEYEKAADNMQEKLNEKLWNDESKYLMNYWEDGKLDEHYYIGSLLAAHYNLIADDKKKELVETASKKLLDPKIGIYTVYPMDFNKLIDFLKFAGNEAGDPYKYINGGIWSHGNSWYALALIAAGEKEKAFKFVKDVMTIDGVINSPNGQPAMYEYRNSNNNDQIVYGKIDKPQFMWAAGWYIYTLYHLFGIEENEWNISLNPFINNDVKESDFSLAINGIVTNVLIHGKGKFIEKILYDNKSLNSSVIPADIKPEKIGLRLGKLVQPYIHFVDGQLLSCNYKDNTLTSTINSYEGKEIMIKIYSPKKPNSVLVNNNKIENLLLNEIEGGYDIIIKHKVEKRFCEVSVKF